MKFFNENCMDEKENYGMQWNEVCLVVGVEQSSRFCFSPSSPRGSSPILSVPDLFSYFLQARSDRKYVFSILKTVVLTSWYTLSCVLKRWL